MKHTAAQVAEQVREQLGGLWLPELYQTLIKPKRTRSVTLNVPARINEAEILHTLLGVELQVGRKRINCPDLATARYLMVFVRLGCKEVAQPYDITQLSHLADELESAWQRMLLLVEEAAGPRGINFVTRVRKLLAGQARESIAAQGAGPAIPQFNQDTRQRRRI
jgi:hypothetical protein